MKTIWRALILATVAALALPLEARADGGRTLFIASAVEHPDGTATFPLYRGTSKGRTVWYIVLDSSSGADAQAKGVNNSSKLANASGSAAVQKFAIVNDVVDFPASVDFTPVRQVAPGPQGFPPALAGPEAIREPGWSLFFLLPHGTSGSAPQIANASGRADKIVAFDSVGLTV